MSALSLIENLSGYIIASSENTVLGILPLAKGRTRHSLLKRDMLVISHFELEVQMQVLTVHTDSEPHCYWGRVQEKVEGELSILWVLVYHPTSMEGHRHGPP